MSEDLSPQTKLKSKDDILQKPSVYVRSLNPDGSMNIHRKNFPRRAWWSDISHAVLSMTWPRFFLLLGLIYTLVNFVFAIGYYVLGPEGLNGVHYSSSLDFFTECFFFSVQTFSTIGYGQISPVRLPHHILVAIQALTGMLSIGLMSGLSFTRFLKPTAKVRFSNVALITHFNGKRAFVARMANARMNQVVEATASLTILKSSVTQEGQAMRLLSELPLVRNRNAIFSLSWTIIHLIDENSPLFNMSPEDLERANVEIFVNITGYDETFSNVIHSRRSYVSGEIIYDRQFEDMMSRDEDGVSIDLDKISELKTEKKQ